MPLLKLLKELEPVKALADYPGEQSTKAVQQPSFFGECFSPRLAQLLIREFKLQEEPLILPYLNPMHNIGLKENLVNAVTRTSAAEFPELRYKSQESPRGYYL